MPPARADCSLLRTPRPPQNHHRIAVHQVVAHGAAAPGGRFCKPQESHKLSEASSTGRSNKSSLPGCQTEAGAIGSDEVAGELRQRSERFIGRGTDQSARERGRPAPQMFAQEFLLRVAAQSRIGRRPVDVRKRKLLWPRARHMNSSSMPMWSGRSAAPSATSKPNAR